MKPIKIDKKQLEKYAVAPYNFVSFPDKAQTRYNDVSQLPKHNSYKDKDGNKLLNGYISYKLKAETPIIVSSGITQNVKEANFFTNLNGEYAIPGNTVRGMVKTNAYILGFSSAIGSRNKNGEYFDSSIEDSTFLFRDVAGNNSLSRKYISLLGIHPIKRIAQNIKAGYMVNRGNNLYIEPAEEILKGKSYFRIDEIELRKTGDKDLTGINYMYNEGLLKKEEELKALNKSIVEARQANNGRRVRELEREVNRVLQSYENNKRSSKPYKEYQTTISFEYDKTHGRITKVGKVGTYKNNGYILSGGYIRGKRSHYIIPKTSDDVEAIKVSNEKKESYIDDLIMTKKAEKTSEGARTKRGYEFWELPKSNEKKPVFYININEELHFGFTPYLRMFYSKSILDGVPKEYKDIEGISYVDSMFGFSNREIKGKNVKISYKSRVSFEDVVAIGKVEVDRESSIKMLLAEPKPTSFNLYLVQKNEDKRQLSIYDGDFRIRGIKQYWLKNYIEQPEVKSEAMSFTINPLKEGTCFEGKIYFNNLYEDELGLLLWSLQLNEGCRQNIGLAKSYGFGRVIVHDVELSIEDIDKKYGEFCFDYIVKENVNKYINAYKYYFSKEKLNGRNIEEEIPVKELIHIKSKIVKENEANNYRYMSIEREYLDNGRQYKENEFKDKKVLPEILNYDNKHINFSFSKAQNISVQHESKEKHYLKERNKKNQAPQKGLDKRGNGGSQFNTDLAKGLEKWQEKNK